MKVVVQYRYRDQRNWKTMKTFPPRKTRQALKYARTVAKLPGNKLMTFRVMK